MADDKKKFVIANDEFDDIDATTKNVVITDSEFDDIDDSPKSPAPSMKGGESGALVRPLTPTSASEGSKSESWTQTVNPFADKGAVKPTQQAGAAQAPKAKLLKVIPSSEKKSPELLKARVDTYGDMYKRAMDRAYTLKQSVEGVDNELKNSKAYVDSNPNDQNAINSYNALISKRNEMAEMARMEISRADAWQKGIEKTQLEIDESLTASESISNSISNMATQIKGFLPASGLAISTLQNKVMQGAIYVSGKLMGYDDETASRVGTELSQNLPSAGILGTTQKEARQFYTERLGELEKEQKPTKSIIKTFEDGDVAGLGAAILDGGSSIISSVITSAPTGGVGIFTEMMGRSVYDFNNEKAKRLKISVDELYDRGLDEAAVPLAIGAVSASLEKIGLEGISKAINKKIGSKAVKDIFEIVLEGSKEAGTEWLQTGAEEYNKAIARGMNVEQAGEAALSKMLSEEGREAALKGAAGSGVSIATGRAAKSLYGMAKSNRDKLYQDLAKVETLARERANPNLSSEALASIDREINNTTANMQKEVLDQLNRRANLTEENASLVEGIEANVKTISDDIESKKLLSEDPSLSDDAKIIIDLEIADLEAKRLDLAAQSEEIIKNNRPVVLTKNTSPTNEKYGTVNRNDGKGVVDLTKEEYDNELNKATPETVKKPITQEDIDNLKYELRYPETNELVRVPIKEALESNDKSSISSKVDTENKFSKQRIKSAEEHIEKSITGDNENTNEASIGGLDREGNLVIGDGRHRLLALQNKGIEYAFVEVSKDDAQVIKDKFATTPTETAGAVKAVPIAEEGFDYNRLFDANDAELNKATSNKEESDKALIEAERESDYQKTTFDKRWAATYKEAKNKLVKQYIDAKKELETWSNKSYKSAGESSVFVGDEMEGQNVKIDYINNKRKQNRITNAKSDMEMAISDLRAIGLTDIEIDEITNEQSSDVNIQQPMGESKVDDGAVGEVAKEELPKGEVGSVGVGGDVKEPKSYAEATDAYKATELGGSEDAKNKKQALVEQAETEEGKKFVESEVSKLEKNDDGTITVFRSGTLQEGHNPATTSRKTAEIIASERKKQGLSSDIVEVRVNPSDISVVVKGIESEVFVKVDKNNKERLQQNTTQKQKTKTELLAERDALQKELNETKETNDRINKAFNDGTFKFSENVFKDADRKQKAKIKNLEWQLSKIEQSLKETPQAEEKVSGGLTQEEKVNLENISKDAGVNFQEVRNVYNKYGEGKPLNEITLEDYQKAEEKRQELLTPKQEQDAKKQQSGQMREQGVQDQPQGKGDSDMPIINEAELQDGEAVEEEVTQEELNKQQDKETQVLLNGEAAKRRSAGKFIKDGVEYVRNKVDKGIRGIKGSVKFAEGVPNMPFTYKLVEAETLQPSHSQGVRNQMHFIPEAQPKRRNDEGSVAAEIGFANNPRFNELGENTNAYSGAPVVNERNEVVQGNNRSAGLKIGYDRGNKKYKNDLADNAEKFGFTREQVEGMKNPVLVREVAFSDEGAIEYGNYDAKDLETGGKRRIDPLALVKRIPLKEKARLAKLLFSGEGTLNSNIRANSKDVLAILNPFLNQAQRTTLLKDGEITSSGVEDIEALVQQFLFDNGDMALPELFENLPYRQREGIRKSLPFIFSAGVEADVIPEIQNAILALNQFQSTGIENFDTWLNQSDVFADNKTPRDIYTPQELAIARALNEAKTQSEIVDKFKSFSSAVQGTPETPANLIDEAKPAIEGQSKEEALKQIFNVKENESRQKENLRGGKKVDKQQEAPKQKPKEPTAEEVEEEGLPKLTKEQQIEAERRSLNEPKNVSDLAKIFNKVLGLSPKESVMAARLFDVKAKNMSELLGITKDEYYQRYWFTGEQEGGLSQTEAYHGSPYKFDKFTTEKIGTGEGAQAFGWGLYFTDLEGIARGYAEELAKFVDVEIDGKKVESDTLLGWISLLQEQYSGQKITKEDLSDKAIERAYEYGYITKSDYDLIKNAKEVNVRSIKNLYKVSLHKGKTPDQYTWLEWDKPASEKQKNLIGDLISEISGEGSVAKKATLKNRVLKSDTGSQLYREISSILGSDKSASLLLLDAGIDGVKYPAESIARGATSDTARGFNYVVFDENAVTIEEAKMFQDRRGAWSKIAASAKRIISMYDKARLDTAVHEILGHDFLDEIISLSATNKEFEQDLNTIIDEYIKSSGNKTSKATLLNELKNFNVESNNQSVNARAIHEWFSRTAEGYFMGETNIKPDSKLAKMFEQFRQYLTDLFNTMTSRNYIIPSEPMKQIFRKAFGAENFDFVNDYAEANIMEGKLDVLRIAENEIPQSRLDKFKKLREERKGLGQEEDVDIDELVDAARYLSTDPTVNVFNVVDELVSMYPQKEEYIRKHSKTFEKVFVAEGKKVRETARSVYESDVVSPEMKQRAATIEDLFSYTPEKLQEKMEDVESLIADYSIDDLMAFFATSNEIPFKEYPLFLAAMQKRISRAINELNNSNQGQSAAKQKLLNYEMTIMDRYIAEGTATGQRLNYFKVLKNMSTDGKLRFFKRKFKEESGNAVKEFQDLISNLRKERDKAYKDNDYFLEENLSLEQRIEDLEAELAKERSTKARNDKRKDRESLSQAKPPKRKISQSELNDILKELGSTGLGQSLEDLNAALKLGFYIIQDKPKTIEQFTKDWNKITKQNKTQEELSEVYRDVRKYATENEGVDIDYFDSDAMIQSSIDSFNERASQKKNLAKKELDSDIAKAEKEAMKTQMSEKDKEVKAKEALKKREKEIRDNFLDSLSQDGLWQQYVKSVSGRILGNLGSKLGAKQSEKALLDEFTQLATNELNKAIDELMPKQKGGKAATPNYAQQLGDLIANQEKLADIFDKAVKDFAEKNKGNANAQSVLSKLNGLKNPFSEKLMENALEKEAQNYAIKIGDLAFKYAGLRQNLKDQIVAQIVAETGLTGQQATQLEQDLRAKFDNIIAETEQDTAGQLAKAILSNAKKELGLGKKQQDYVKELLGYLKNKAKDYYKTTNKQALVDPFEQLKYAVEMLNDANGRKIWDDSKAELIAKIDSDKDLSQQEKDDLKAYLDDYQNAIFDQLLSKNKLFNNVKKVLSEESPFVKKDGSVDWNGIIIQAKGNVEIAKQIILDSVADKLQGYSGSQVNSVIDAIGREYQRRINEKRAEIIEKQLKDISDKKIIFKKKIATGFVQKLVEMENSGALGDQRFEQALKDWIGFSDMTPDKWNRLRELIVDAEEAPEGNERDRAIENLSAYIKFNKIGKFAEIYASAYYAGLLARPTTIIKNSTGIIEPLLTLFYKSFTDRNYARAMIQGLKRGDAADIWGGGLVQGGKLDEETGNDGLPRVNMLKQWRRQEKGIIPKLFALGAKPLDFLSMADALSQAMVERGAEYEFYARYLLEKNKEDIRNGVQGVVPITEKEARRIAIKRLSDDAMLDWAFAQAEDEFASRKIVPSSARLNRRAYEIVSESLLPTSVRELAQNLALEESYKSKLISFRGMTSQTRAQKRLETNYGVATFIGSFAKGLVDLLAEGGGYVAGGATKVLPVTEARRNQIRNSVERSISMRVLPFARGISNVVEKSLEKTPYGIVSGVIGATAEKFSYGKPKTIDEILQHQYMMNRNKAKIAKSATSMIIGSAIYYTLLSASKEWDDEEEKEEKEERYYLPTGFYSAGETVRFGKNKIERYTLPVNCVVLYGRIIPLSLFGTVGIGSMITAQAYDNFLSKEKKKQGAVVDPDNPESIKGFNSFVSSSGNAILNMSAMQSISELQESVSSKGTMDFGDYASKLSVKSIALPIPFSGTANQIIQGARYLSGDKTAQAAIGADEKIYKELGLAGIVYNRPVLDWRGRPVNAVLQNQEGIASFVSMLDKRPLDKIDMYLLKELEFNPVIDKRLSENFADLNMVGMSKDEYYDYTKKVGMTANNYIEAYFDTIKNYQIPQYKIDELAAEGKNETDLKKQLKTIKKTFVSDFLNIAEQEHMLNYQFSKGIIKETYEAKFKANNDRLENLIEKINDKGE